MRPYFLATIIFITIFAGCTSTNSNWERVSAEDFSEEIENNPDAFILDVRTQEEWEEDGHLEGATLIPHSSLESRDSELPIDKEETLLVYCRSGNRSQQAAQTLQEMGYIDIIELESGIIGWKDAGYSVVND